MAEAAAAIAAAINAANETVKEVKPKPTYGPINLTLENCILPERCFEKSPSSIDGLSANHEYDLRVLGTELIQSSGILLKLPQVAMACGQVLFQRFYYSKSFVRCSMEHTAMACVTLASKIEEAPRRIRDVVHVFHHLKQLRTGKPIQSMQLDSNYINNKNQVIKAERRLLKELGFCVHVKHPHKFIVTLLQGLECEKNHRLMQTSWNYMNDSLRTDVFVRYTPETIACACIYLSARVLRIPLPNNPPWFEVFGVNEGDIRRVCLFILELYTRPKPDQEMLEQVVNNLKEEFEAAKLRAKGLLENGVNNAKLSASGSTTAVLDSKTNSPDNKEAKTPEVQVLTENPVERKELSKSTEKIKRHRRERREVKRDSRSRSIDHLNGHEQASPYQRSPPNQDYRRSYSRSHSRERSPPRDRERERGHHRHENSKSRRHRSRSPSRRKHKYHESHHRTSSGRKSRRRDREDNYDHYLSKRRHGSRSPRR